MNNVMLGNEAANVLDGGAGNDVLNGEEGADTFIFGLGSGQDVVADTTQSGAVDTVQVKAGLTSTDLTVFHRGEDLVLNFWFDKRACLGQLLWTVGMGLQASALCRWHSVE